MEKYYDNTKYYHLIPLIMMIVCVPLMVHLKVVPLSGPSYLFWNGQQQNFDFFSYYKTVWINIFTVFAFIMLLVKFYENGKNFVRKSYDYYIPIGIYSLFVIISTLTSEYKEIALKGFPDRYEGMYILLAYMIILFLTMNLVEKEDHVKAMIVSLLIGATIIGLIGLFQYMGYDLWKTNIGKSIMIPSKYMLENDKIIFKFNKYEIYSTLYHYNYVGSYMAMLFPLTFSMFILIKNKKVKCILALITLLMAINLIGSNARSGIIGTVFAFIMLLIVMNKYIKRNFKYFLSGIAVLIFIFLGLNVTSKGAVANRFKSLLTDVKEITQDSDESLKEISKLPLQGIEVSGNAAKIITPTETLILKEEDGGVIFNDVNNNKLSLEAIKETGEFTIKSSNYKNYRMQFVRIGDENIFVIKKDSIKLYFKIANNEIKLSDNRGNILKTEPVESWGFKGKERLGSSRGYIWSRSIPLLKNTIVKGYGPDTFAAYFPQQDFKGKMYAYYGDMWQIVDKPHNLYLQTALSTGILSLIALLALFGMYIVKSISLYFKSEYDDFLSIAGVSIFIAVCGYLGAGLFNDSVVSVAPVFWIILGTGIAINHMISQEKKLNTKM
ncbi:O-antigen ligase family protein [Clostridium malenominatum]|uniref:O-antigen ligase family protein n=1 Tax=Clostridium malenominatum TaxID=1539 RepID=A0ABN1J2W4_9CLOT